MPELDQELQYFSPTTRAQYETLISQRDNTQSVPQGSWIDYLSPQTRSGYTREQLDSARRYEQSPLPAPEEDMDTYFLNRSVPFASAIRNFNQTSRYAEARDAIARGERTQGNRDIVAANEASQLRDNSNSTLANIASGVAHVPALIGEALVGGAVVGRVAPALANAPRLLPSLLPGATRSLGLSTANVAANTALMPSMWLSQSAERAARNGGEWYEPQNIGPAAVMGLSQVAVLGSLGAFANNIPGAGAVPFLKRMATRTGVGMFEQQMIDAVYGVVDQVLPQSWQMGTHGGIVGLALQGKFGEAAKHAMVQAAVFATFSALHPVLHGEKGPEVAPPVGEEAVPSPIPEPNRPMPRQLTEPTQRPPFMNPDVNPLPRPEVPAPRPMPRPLSEPTQMPGFMRPRQESVQPESRPADLPKPLESLADLLVDPVKTKTAAAQRASFIADAIQKEFIKRDGMTPEEGRAFVDGLGLKGKAKKYAQDAMEAITQPREAPTPTEAAPKPATVQPEPGRSVPVPTSAGPGVEIPILAKKPAVPGVGSIGRNVVAPEVVKPIEPVQMPAASVPDKVSAAMLKANLTAKDRMALESVFSRSLRDAGKDQGVSQTTIDNRSKSAFQKLRAADPESFGQFSNLGEYLESIKVGKRSTLEAQSRGESTAEDPAERDVMEARRVETLREMWEKEGKTPDEVLSLTRDLEVEYEQSQRSVEENRAEYLRTETAQGISRKKTQSAIAEALEQHRKEFPHLFDAEVAAKTEAARVPDPADASRAANAPDSGVPAGESAQGKDPIQRVIDAFESGRGESSPRASREAALREIDRMTPEEQATLEVLGNLKQLHEEPGLLDDRIAMQIMAREADPVRDIAKEKAAKKRKAEGINPAAVVVDVAKAIKGIVDSVIESTRNMAIAEQKSRKIGEKGYGRRGELPPAPEWAKKLRDRMLGGVENLVDELRTLSSMSFVQMDKASGGKLGILASMFTGSPKYVEAAMPDKMAAVHGPKPSEANDTLNFAGHMEYRRRTYRENALKEEKRARDSGEDKEADRYKAIAEKIKSFVGNKGSPLKTNADFDSWWSSAEGKRYREAYRDNFRDDMHSFYRMQKGDADAIDNVLSQIHDMPINFLRLTEAQMIAREQGIDVGERTTGRTLEAGRLENIKNRKSQFDQMSDGDLPWEAYDTNLTSVLNYSMADQASKGTKSQYYRGIQESGLGVLDNGGKTNFVLPNGDKTFEHPNAIGNKSLYVSERIKGEFRQSLRIEDPANIPILSGMARLATKAVMIMPVAEGVAHLRNQGTSMFAPGVIPIIDHVIQGYKYWTGDATFKKNILDLARIDATKAKGLESGQFWGGKYDPSGWVGKLIDATDHISRAVLKQAYERGVASGRFKGTDAELRDFVNTGLGNYNKQSQHKMIAWLRDTGLGPFATAATNFYMQGLRMMGIGPMVKATSTAHAIGMRAEIIGKAVAFLGLAFAANKAAWGSIFGDDDTPFGAIKTGKTANGKTTYFDLTAMTGLTRGMRQIGLLALTEGARQGSSPARIADRAFDGAFQSLLHATEGPLFQIGHTLATGKNAVGQTVERTPPPSGSHLYERGRAALIGSNPISAAFLGADKNHEDMTFGQKAIALLGPYNPFKQRGDAVLAEMHGRLRELEDARKVFLSSPGNVGGAFPREAEYAVLHKLNTTINQLEDVMKGRARSQSGTRQLAVPPPEQVARWRAEITRLAQLALQIQERQRR